MYIQSLNSVIVEMFFVWVVCLSVSLSYIALAILATYIAAVPVVFLSFGWTLYWFDELVSNAEWIPQFLSYSFSSPLLPPDNLNTTSFITLLSLCKSLFLFFLFLSVCIYVSMWSSSRQCVCQCVWRLY